MPIAVIGAMTGALLGGTIASATLGRATIGYEALIALGAGPRPSALSQGTVP
jgi:hypothetical protein